MNKKLNFSFINSFWLHIIAMAIMLIDHMWGTVMRGNMWMTDLGRLAFPIFAFMLVEGFFHTKSLKKYFIRLLIGAVISEIPFNLMMGGVIFDPYEQSVMCTFLLAFGCMALTELVKKKNKYLAIPCGILIFLLGTAIAFLTFVDYYGYGILTVGLFYAFRGKKWWQMVIQAVGMYLINVTLFGGMIIDVNIFGHSFEVVQQGFAVLSLIFIWLYNGKKGPGGKKFQYFCYLFYPVHILILSLIALAL